MSKTINMIGKKYNRLVGIKYLGKRPKSNNTVWEFVCDCGKRTVGSGSDVRSGRKKSCGCLLSETGKSNAIDISGFRSGRLVAIEPIGSYRGRKVIWRCKCDCGNYTSVVAGDLRRQRTKSCGCLVRENFTNKKHGLSYTSAYVRDKKMRYLARKYSSSDETVTPMLINELLGQQCSYCGKNGNIVVEHVIPLSRGGEHSIHNIVPSCDRCNTIKGDRSLLWFLLYI